MTTKIFVTAEGEELTIEDALVRAMRAVTAMEVIMKEQDTLMCALYDRVNLLEKTITEM